MLGKLMEEWMYKLLLLLSVFSFVALATEGEDITVTQDTSKVLSFKVSPKLKLKTTPIEGRAPASAEIIVPAEIDGTVPSYWLEVAEDTETI